MKSIVQEQTVTVEVKISGHVSSREELDIFMTPSIYPNKDHNYRGVVHIDDHMEWQWAKTEKEAKDWVKNKLKKYIKL